VLLSAFVWRSPMECASPGEPTSENTPLKVLDMRPGTYNLVCTQQLRGLDVASGNDRKQSPNEVARIEETIE
jgi:hypothetical protein